MTIGSSAFCDSTTSRPRAAVAAAAGRERSGARSGESCEPCIRPRLETLQSHVAGELGFLAPQLPLGSLYCCQLACRQHALRGDRPRELPAIPALPIGWELSRALQL